jgi:hypothetical protein
MRRALVALAAVVALAVVTATAHGNPRNEVFVPIGDEGNAELIDEEVEEFIEDPQTETERLELEYLYATGFHPAANQMVGVADSLYRGKWFVKRHEPRRKCIIRRESKANYEAVSAGGLYRGAYQMSRALAIGATWMMQPEVRKEMGAEGLAMVEALRGVPPNKWNRYWQDRAFWTVWAKGEGKRHWRSGVRSC